MRALSACLTVVLGLGVAAIAACSSTSSDTGSGGAAGASTGGTSSGGKSSGGTSAGGTSSGGTTSSAGKGGSSTAGTSAVGTAGAGGAAECSFDSADCGSCIQAKCDTEFAACGNDQACGLALSNIQPCLCNSSTSAAECETKFISDGKTAGKAFADCFDANCKSVCE